jgi:hypothetical protein
LHRNPQTQVIAAFLLEQALYLFSRTIGQANGVSLFDSIGHGVSFQRS